MTVFYSDHYGPAVGATGHFTTRSIAGQLPLGKGLARVYKKFAYMTPASGLDMGDDDVIRVMDLKSGWRIIEVFFSMDADFGATTTFNIGLYKKGEADNGAVLDEDLFASAVDWSGAITRVDYFKESATLTDMDRGKTLWELVTIGAAATYTQDPMEVWTLTCQTTQDISATAAAVTMSCEVTFLANA